MASSQVPKRWIGLIAALLVLLGGLGALQVWSAIATRDIVQQAIDAPLGKASADYEAEKTRQEAIGKRIENRSKALLQANLASALGAGLGVAISAAGVVMALITYFAGREKDREDRRIAAEKDRQDRLSVALSETIERLVGEEPRQRVVGVAGLLPFFAEDRADFHLQALSALVAAARAETEPPEVRQGVRLAIEQAVRNVKGEVMRRLSWQGVRLAGADLSGCDFTGVDLRDADLQDARLERATFQGANLTAAKLQGARLGKANLAGADLTYADLAGADATAAAFTGARVNGVKVLNLELRNADLTDVVGWRGVPLDATRNWRTATFGDEARAELDERYGPAAPDQHVLMLMWEAPPFVAGGTWTACYHMVRRLRRRGLAVTVVVPWARELIEPTPFGLDVTIVSLGIAPPDGQAASAYGAAPAWSAYGMAPSWSPYGGAGGSPYGGPYGGGAPGVYGGGVQVLGAYGRGLDGSVLFRLIGDVRRRIQDAVRDLKPDVIHAHDWVTFGAARLASEATGAPWVAHFHSTERDRRPDDPDALTLEIERMAVDAAARLVVPGDATRQALIADHGPKASRADVVANMLSDAAPPTREMGRFETARVVFVGRLSAQKGVDRFGQLAAKLRGPLPQARFEVFGDGEDRWTLSGMGLSWRGLLPWARRGEAFAGASLIVVPSRAEPFGMVVLEAMQHRVPVIYPAQSGAAEALASGVKVDPGDTDAMAAQALRLMGDLGAWEAVVRSQADEIDAYPDRDYDERLMGIWREAVGASV